MKRAVLLIAWLPLASAHAATLKELLEAADAHNVDQRISRAQRERSAAEFRAAWTSMLPSLTASGNYTYNQYPARIPASPLTGGNEVVITPEHQLDGIVRAELPLVDAARWFRTLAAGAALDAAERRTEAVRDAIRRQVTATYFGYAAALSVRASAQRSLGVAEAQLRLQEVRLRSGVVTELEVLRARAEVARSRQTVSDADALVANSRRALQTLTGVDPGEAAALPEDDLRPEGELADLERRTEELPSVRAAEKDAEAAGRLSTAAHLALVPLITANFTERLTNYAGFTGRTNAYTAGIGLAWRLDGAIAFNARAQASQTAIARLAVERTKLQARDQVHTDYQRLSAAIQKVTAAQAQVEAARRAAQLARDRFEIGVATQLDVITSERDLFTAEVNQIQARTDLASSRVSLRISAGLPLGIE